MKTKFALLQGEKDIKTLATENDLNLAKIRTWKKEILEGCSRAFVGKK